MLPGAPPPTRMPRTARRAEPHHGPSTAAPAATAARRLPTCANCATHAANPVACPMLRPRPSPLTPQPAWSSTPCCTLPMSASAAKVAKRLPASAGCTRQAPGPPVCLHRRMHPPPIAERSALGSPTGCPLLMATTTSPRAQSLATRVALASTGPGERAVERPSSAAFVERRLHPVVPVGSPTGCPLLMATTTSPRAQSLATRVALASTGPGERAVERPSSAAFVERRLHPVVLTVVIE